MEETDLKINKEWLEGADLAYQRIIKYIKEKESSSLTDTVLVMMIKNLLERVETIVLLSELDREESITILTRAFLELNVSLSFILKEDTDNRAKSYYYNNKIQAMKNLVKMNRSDAHYDLALSDEEVNILQKSVPEGDSIEDYISYYEKDWKEMFSTKPNTKREYDRRWYALNWEYSTLKDMMRSIDINDATYHFFYGITSIDAHGMGATGNIKMDGSNYKVIGSLPSAICYTMIDSYLSTTMYEVSEYYNLLEDEEQISYLSLMANTSISIE